MKTAVVIGASGDVGTGITSSLLQNGYRVVAVGRSLQSLQGLRTYLSAGDDLVLVSGSVGTPDDARMLAGQIADAHEPDAVVVTVNGNASATALVDLGPDDLLRVTQENIAPHLHAAHAFVPRLKAGATYLGIGGGMADLVYPGMAAISMAQAAQRMLYRYLAHEKAFRHVHVRELLLHAMISGRNRPGTDEAHGMTADEVGRHILAILSDLETFAGPILNLRSRKQVTFPEHRPAA